LFFTIMNEHFTVGYYNDRESDRFNPKY